jgi:hypothetical protein
VFTLADVVPWGRSFEEYRRMFALEPGDLRVRLLGCGDGPASFNAEATRLGATVVSCDPIYQFDVDALRTRIAETRDQILEQTRRNAHEFEWTVIPSVEALDRERMAAMGAFLEDFPAGREAGRYVTGALPDLPFASGHFDLALCSHFLFLYSAQRDVDFHVASVLELCRVAREVRIFPLLALGGARSPHLDAVVARCGALGRETRIERVPYEFQRGATEMLRILPA